MSHPHPQSWGIFRLQILLAKLSSKLNYSLILKTYMHKKLNN